jgi:hypothetical protein
MQWRVDPAEWDFRFIDPEEFPLIAVYQYASNCPWVTALWSKWLDSQIPAVRVVQLDVPTVVFDDKKTRRLGDVLRKYYPASVSCWPDDITAAHIWHSFPEFLRIVGLDNLLLRTPSFPKPWGKLPDRERKAALFLSTPVRNTYFTEVNENTSPAEHVYKVTMNLDASPDLIRAAFHRWLRIKCLEHGKQQEALTRQTEKERGYKIKKRPDWNPPYEVLRWLSAYRLKTAGFTYKGVIEEARRRLTAVPVPDNLVDYPALPTYKTVQTCCKAVRKAQRLMGFMFIPSPGPFNSSPVRMLL